MFDKFDVIRQKQILLAMEHVAIESSGNEILKGGGGGGADGSGADEDLAELFDKNSKQFDKIEVELDSLFLKLKDLNDSIWDIADGPSKNDKVNIDANLDFDEKVETKDVEKKVVEKKTSSIQDENTKNFDNFQDAEDEYYD